MSENEATTKKRAAIAAEAKETPKTEKPAKDK